MKKTAMLLLLLCTLTSCPFLESFVTFDIDNKSNDPLLIYLCCDGYTGPIYPDTILPPSSVGRRIRPHLKEPYKCLGNSFDEVFKRYFRSDTGCIAIVSADTIAKYGWEDVRANHRVLVRYDLSYPDFMLLNKVITYPPTPEMSHMKMWPPYQQVINKAKQRH